MTTRVKRWMALTLVSMLLLGGCATPSGQNGRVAVETFGRGVANLLLSPLMIVSGIAQGLAFLPYTIGVGLGELNRSLIQAQAVSLDDSYKATFGVSIDDRQVDQKSGDVHGPDSIYGRFHPDAMPEAQRAFERLLVAQGMSPETAQRYVLAGNYSQAWSRGHVLLAVVYRHPGQQPFRVVGKQTGIATTLRPDQRGWREPYARDADGQTIDEVVDWGALEYKVLRQDKVVAMLLALAAESVKQGKRADDYWQVERRWTAGESATIIREANERVRRAMPG